MDTDGHESESDLTEAIIGSAFEAANVPGAGFLEKVYEHALIRELAIRGVSAKAQVSFPVRYKGHYVGEYVADLVVEEKVIVELKCVDRFCQRASGAMHQLPEGLSAHQFSKT
jgi:GxxExxY protein